MRAFTGLSLIIASLIWVGCGKNESSPETPASEQSFEVPQECYDDPVYRADHADGLCASVPSDVDPRCYTDTAYRLNNLANGVCSNTPYDINGDSSIGSQNCFSATNCDQQSSTGIFVPVQTGSSCQSCPEGYEVVVDPTDSRMPISCHRRQVLSAHQFYVGVTYSKRRHKASKTKVELGYQYSQFHGQQEQAIPINTCQGRDARVACDIYSAQNDCAYYLGNGRASCIPEPNRNFGFCGIR